MLAMCKMTNPVARLTFCTKQGGAGAVVGPHGHASIKLIFWEKIAYNSTTSLKRVSKQKDAARSRIVLDLCIADYFVEHTREKQEVGRKMSDSSSLSFRTAKGKTSLPVSAECYLHACLLLPELEDTDGRQLSFWTWMGASCISTWYVQGEFGYARHIYFAISGEFFKGIRVDK